MLNVDPSTKDDAFYRYKMPALVWKVEGKGNGIKTVIVNVAEIAASLQRPAEYLMKSLSTDLGVGMKIENERWVLMGDHVKQDPYKLQNKLYEFIQKGVLCKHCRNPETAYVVEKGRLMMQCKACSKRSDTTVNEKVSTVILKHESELQAEVDKQQTKDEKDEAQWNKELAGKGKVVVAPIEEAPPQHKGNPVTELAKVVEAGVGETTIVDKVFDLKQEYGMQEKDMAKLVFRTYFHDKNAATSCMTIRTCANVLKRFTGPELQTVVVDEAEHYAHRNKAVMFPKFPIFLFELMERSIIGENTVITWHESGRSKGLNRDDAADLRKITEPFVTILKKQN